MSKIFTAIQVMWIKVCHIGTKKYLQISSTLICLKIQKNQGGPSWDPGFTHIWVEWTHWRFGRSVLYIGESAKGDDCYHFFIIYHQNHYHVKDHDGDHDIILKGGHCFRSSRHSAGNGNWFQVRIKRALFQTKIYQGLFIDLWCTALYL